MTAAAQDNMAALLREMDWLQAVVQQAVCSYLKQEGHERRWQEIPAPDLRDDASEYAATWRKLQLSLGERLALALGLAPHLRPEALDILFGVNEMTGRSFSEFGGATQKDSGGFIPSGQTLVFVYSANDPQLRAEALAMLQAGHRLHALQMLEDEAEEARHARSMRPWRVQEGWLQQWISGAPFQPEHNPGFPASPISTPLEWADLVLDFPVQQQVLEIVAWIQHGAILMQEWGLARHLKPGYRSLFFGPPGSGKTLTASLLGKHCQRAVYRVDLSMLVSKYIGETEKNLGRLFDVARFRDWILFFDEADALFGKRTAANNSNDRFANQQTSYLLQRIEDFPGVVILASNLRANMDEAFTRRFQSMIHFPMPGPQQRRQLWRQSFAALPLQDSIDWDMIAERYELAGGAIINVLRYCALLAAQRGRTPLAQEDVMDGIRREFAKDNRTLRE